MKKSILSILLCSMLCSTAQQSHAVNVSPKVQTIGCGVAALASGIGTIYCYNKMQQYEKALQALETDGLNKEELNDLSYEEQQAKLESRKKLFKVITIGCGVTTAASLGCAAWGGYRWHQANKTKAVLDDKQTKELEDNKQKKELEKAYLETYFDEKAPTEKKFQEIAFLQLDVVDAIRTANPSEIDAEKLGQYEQTISDFIPGNGLPEDKSSFYKAHTATQKLYEKYEDKIQVSPSHEMSPSHALFVANKLKLHLAHNNYPDGFAIQKRQLNKLEGCLLGEDSTTENRRVAANQVYDLQKRFDPSKILTKYYYADDYNPDAPDAWEKTVFKLFENPEIKERLTPEIEDHLSTMHGLLDISPDKRPDLSEHPSTEAIMDFIDEGPDFSHNEIELLRVLFNQN